MTVVRLKRLAHGEDVAPPAYQTELAAGADVCAAVEETVTLAPGERFAVPTGFAMAVEAGWEVQVRPRSGLAFKHGVTCLNAPGTIDADYRGEVKVVLVNHGDQPFVIERGDRIAQLVVARAPQAAFHLVDDLDATARGGRGFGSTGV